MLPQLYSELTNLHLRVQELAANGREGEATFVFKRILEVERQISAIPAESLADAAVKLRFLKVDIGPELNVAQRQMLDEVLTVLRRATEH